MKYTPDPKHQYHCPKCGGRSFHAFPMCGTVAFQCASCKQVSLYDQLKGGDTSGEEPDLQEGDEWHDPRQL